MMSHLKIPQNILSKAEAHERWLKLLDAAEKTIQGDVGKPRGGKVLRIKERHVPPRVLGKSYAQYCDLINKLYDAYLSNVHLQRAPYMVELISVIWKRLYELRKELVLLIVNDYIYVDEALVQLKMTPDDIQIAVPYHFAVESRPDSIDHLLQKMWLDAVKRKKQKPVKEKPPPPPPEPVGSDEMFFSSEPPVEEDDDDDDDESTVSVESVHTVIPEEYIQAVVIQRSERFRKFFMADFKVKCANRRTYFAQKVEDAPLEIRAKAAALIQKAYRAYMKAKRKRVSDAKRDMILGMVPDPCKQWMNYEKENNKLCELHRQQRLRIEETYLKDLEQENTRLLVFRKDDQIDDITDQVREWFKEWYYDYGFFPQYPYPLEDGTIMVIRGDYPSVEEKIEEDEKRLAATKGKTKEQLKDEAERAAAEAEMKAEVAAEAAKKAIEQEFKMRCNPFGDPGYPAKESQCLQNVIDSLQKYRAAWSIYDSLPPEHFAEVVYGYMSHLITEDLMNRIHKECRIYVDELMRLDLKLLIKKHQHMYKIMGMKYPKFPPRKKPKAPPVPKTFEITSGLLKNLEGVFDLGIVTKPTSRIKDIVGDLNFAAYDCNIKDPDASFPLPGYGDVKRRLLLTCVFGSGLATGATRRRSVMLLGPPRQGKSFLIDCVAGEMNAIKIDISPEKFSAVAKKPGKLLAQVFNTAKTFQPAVIYLRNIERVFAKKVAPEDRYLKAKSVKKPLSKLLKTISADDKIIFIATCSVPAAAKARPMVSMFDEILLIPRTDYGTLQLFFYNELQRIQSMPRDYLVQPLAKLLQGYGIGMVMELYHQIMTPDRIVKLNVTPLSPAEFLEPLIENEIEPLTVEDYEQQYVKFYVNNSLLKKPRAQYEIMNAYRANAYKKLSKEKAEDKK